jgi:hypothetical protein
MKGLEARVDRVRNELKVGVPKVAAQGGADLAQPLERRLGQFLSVAEKRLAGAKRQMEGAKDPNAPSPLTKDDGRVLESCSCVYGNPCVDEYGCKDWDNRYAVATKNGWKGF